MKEPSRRAFWWLLILVLNLQFAAGLWHAADPFVEGRFHYNWSPAFWLVRAEALNDAGLAHTYLGLADYQSHPQLIAPVISLWTGVFGYSELSVRILALALSVLATLVLTLAVRSWLGGRRALLFSLLFAAMPFTYIYGKMMSHDILVLIFLGLYIWALSLIGREEKRGYFLAGFAALGMSLSDWSGFVLATTIAAVTPALWPLRHHAARLSRLALVTVGSLALGMFTYVLQTQLQAAAGLGTSSAGGLFELWKYRAGFTGYFSWLEWAGQQYHFLSQNFTIPLFLASIVALIATGMRKILPGDERLRQASLLALSVCAGQFVYLLVVPQASGIHIYYQYFFTVPVALGLVLGLEHLATSQIKAEPLHAWILGSALAFAICASAAYYNYQTLLRYPSGVDDSDITLVKAIRQVPEEQSVIAVETTAYGASWYAPPNIEYYAGRPIRAYLLSEGFPPADYLLVPNAHAQQFVEEINTKRPFGKDVSARQEQCAAHICLISLSNEP